MKRKSLAKTITASVTEQLVDYLHGNPKARVVVVYKGKKYGISDTIKSPEGLIFMVDEDDKFAKADEIIDDVMDARGLPLYLEIKGKIIPVKAVDAYDRGIIIEAVCKNNENTEELQEPLKNSANLKDDLVEQIQDWVSFDIEKEQIEAVLWGLAMVNDLETVTRVISEIAEEDKGEKEEIYSSATSVVAGITTKS